MDREFHTSTGPQIAPLVQGLAWPESPRWHDGWLWFSDVHNFRLMRVRPGGMPEVVAEVPGRPAGMGFMPDGSLLLASSLDRKLWWVSQEGRLELAVDLADSVKGLLNDMVVDATGRAWIGDTGFDLLAGEPEVPGALLSWASGSQVGVAAKRIRFPNGIAITPDGATLYLAETFGERVTAFRIGKAGRLDERRLHAALEGRPDGMCLDADGALWVALLWKGEFQRIDRNGEITDRIALGDKRAISCVLGGPDRRTLFLGVAAVQETDDGVQRRGAIQRCTVDVAGAGVP